MRTARFTTIVQMLILSVIMKAVSMAGPRAATVTMGIMRISRTVNITETIVRTMEITETRQPGINPADQAAITTGPGPGMEEGIANHRIMTKRENLCGQNRRRTGP